MTGLLNKGYIAVTAGVMVMTPRPPYADGNTNYPSSLTLQTHDHHTTGSWPITKSHLSFSHVQHHRGENYILQVLMSWKQYIDLLFIFSGKNTSHFAMNSLPGKCQLHVHIIVGVGQLYLTLLWKYHVCLMREKIPNWWMLSIFMFTRIDTDCSRFIIGEKLDSKPMSVRSCNHKGTQLS